jgi:hypothetical protein
VDLLTEVSRMHECKYVHVTHTGHFSDSAPSPLGSAIASVEAGRAALGEGHLMRIVRLLSLLALVGLVPMAAGADPIAVGDVVKFSDGPGTSGGGEFILTDVNNPADAIITFCLQKTEYINFTSSFIVGSITDRTLTDPSDKGGVNGADPISSQTAWLYTQFATNTLLNYDYGNAGNAIFASRQASANALQHAIWGFENEEALDANNYFVRLALNQTPAGFGIGSVGVLNLYLYSPTAPGGLGLEAQDQLTIRSAPEPATLSLVGVGMLGLTLARRKRPQV